MEADHCLPLKYAKDSMDRLGDDLTEVVLKYLRFADRVRLECMSRQWRSVIYRKQFEIAINGNSEDPNALNQLVRRDKDDMKVIDKSALVSVLYKCPNIKRVSVYQIRELTIDGIELEAIGQHCPHLKALECYQMNFNWNIMLDFGRKYGHKLKSVVLHLSSQTYGYENIKKLLKYCPELTKVDICGKYIDNLILVCRDKDIAPKLEEFVQIDDYERVLDLHRIDQEIDKWSHLTNKYRRTVMKVRIVMAYSYGHIYDEIIPIVSLLETMQSLDLSLSIDCDGDRGQTIEQQLRLLSTNCPELKHLRLVFRGNSLLSKRFFDIFNDFWSIEWLSLELDVTKQLKGSVHCLSHCTQLKHLSISYKHLTEQFFSDIQTVVPSITTLDISTDKRITDSFIQSLSKIDSLQRVVVKSDDKRRHYYFGKYLKNLFGHKNVTLISQLYGYYE